MSNETYFTPGTYIRLGGRLGVVLDTNFRRIAVCWLDTQSIEENIVTSAVVEAARSFVYNYNPLPMDSSIALGAFFAFAYAFVMYVSFWAEMARLW
jgi:hypothetical protein